MKLLLLSDLHCDSRKLELVAQNAATFDVVAVAGDLLNIFSSTDEALQVRSILEWKSCILASGAALIWCSGNHDFFHGEDSAILGASPRWMCGGADNFVGDGATSVLRTKAGTIAITTIPWPVTCADVLIGGSSVSFTEHIDFLLEQGQQLQSKHPWLVLNHEPPIGTRLCVDYVSGEANYTRQLIEKWKPDWSLHGHIHESVVNPDGHFFDHVGRTVCFNAGQSMEGEAPRHIVLQLDGGNWSAQWNGVEEFRNRVSGELLPR